MINPEQPTVYIVEDEAFVRASLEGTLEEEGYNVVGSAASAHKALNDILELNPDVVLLDVYLIDEPDGVWIAKKLEEQNHKANIIYLTAYGDKETLERIKGTRPKGYIKKPYDIATLITSIDLLVLNGGDSTRQGSVHSEYEVTFYDGLKSFSLDYRDIQHIVSDGNYLRITTSNGSYFIRANLKDVLDILSKFPFAQIHRSVVINRAFLTEFNSSSASVAGSRFNIGRSFKDVLR
ncbi:MAG: response regulator [Bacteroidetes bacterium]|nr:response regulator [Bacteroidota bacterium]